MDITKVALAVIGDEVLLGEVEDANISIVSREVFRLGADLRYVCVLPDDLDFMVQHLSWMSSSFDLVVTTGGIGATHDDLTKEAVCRVSGRSLVEAPEAVRALEKRVGGELSERMRHLALVPEGSELITNERTAAPGFQVGNLIVLPGIPGLVEPMLEVLKNRVSGRPFHTKAILTRSRESEIAQILEDVQDLYPTVKIGSYPISGAAEYRVRLVMRSRDPGALEKACDALEQRIGK